MVSKKKTSMFRNVLKNSLLCLKKKKDIFDISFKCHSWTNNFALICICFRHVVHVLLVGRMVPVLTMPYYLPQQEMLLK